MPQLKAMEKILSYPISLVALLAFLLALIIFHPIQWICLNVFGYDAHKKSVDYLNCLLLGTGHIIGNSYDFQYRQKIPDGVPLIVVANHQSLFDIVAIIWFLRKYHPKFVSKKELGSGIPSVSYNLRHGGSVLIDRKDPKQALPAIRSLGDYIEKHQRMAVIFPEGTRSKTGVPKEFATTGLKILCRSAPNAYIVPLSINYSWKLAKFGFFPFGLGNRLTFTVHDPIRIKDVPFEVLMMQTETAIVQGINYNN